MKKPTLLDLYCKAGGCAVGYARAGFRVTGVDHAPQANYPFRFVQADALEYLAEHGHEFDVVHASPPCQKFSSGTFCRPEANTKHPDLVTPTLALLQQVARVWIVENVLRAPLSPFSPVLCGLMFGLKLFRHRRFECSHFLWVPPHPSHAGKKVGVDGMVCVAGHGDCSRRHRKSVPADHRNKAAWEKGMGIDWMTRDELAQAIPPAYTHYLGTQLLRLLENQRILEVQ